MTVIYWMLVLFSMREAGDPCWRKRKRSSKSLLWCSGEAMTHKAGSRVIQPNLGIFFFRLREKREFESRTHRRRTLILFNTFLKLNILLKSSQKELCRGIITTIFTNYFLLLQRRHVACWAMGKFTTPAVAGSIFTKKSIVMNPS